MINMSYQKPIVDYPPIRSSSSDDPLSVVIVPATVMPFPPVISYVGVTPVEYTLPPGMEDPDDPEDPDV